MHKAGDSGGGGVLGDSWGPWGLGGGGVGTRVGEPGFLGDSGGPWGLGGPGRGTGESMGTLEGIPGTWEPLINGCN